MTRERRLLASLSVLTLVTIGGALGYVAIEGASFGDGLYMTVMTISTVGFGEVFPLGTAGRLLTTVLIVLGVRAALYTAALGLEIGLERVFGGDVRQRRMLREIDRLDDHIIVCGFGRVGSQTWKALRGEDAPVCVVDSDPAAVERARAAGALVIEGDATRNDVLDAVGIDRARALIACVREDSDNLVIVLSAKHRRRDIPVIARANEIEAEEKLRLAGADRVVSPQMVGAHRLAALAAEPRLDEFVDVILHGKLVELRIEGFEVGAFGSGGDLATRLRHPGVERSAGPGTRITRRGDRLQSRSGCAHPSRAHPHRHRFQRAGRAPSQHRPRLNPGGSKPTCPQGLLTSCDLRS